MSVINFLELKEKLEIREYVKPVNIDKRDHAPFLGSPRKHPFDPARVLLIVDPFSEHTFFYEFSIEDIALAEEQPSISNRDGESVPMVRIWVKNESIALKCTPIVVKSD